MAGVKDRLAQGGLPERQDGQGRGRRDGQVNGHDHIKPHYLTRDQS